MPLWYIAELSIFLFRAVPLSSPVEITSQLTSLVVHKFLPILNNTWLPSPTLRVHGSTIDQAPGLLLLTVVEKMEVQEHQERVLAQGMRGCIQTWPGISWHADPLEMEPEAFLTWLHDFTEHRDVLVAHTKQEIHVLSSRSSPLATAPPL
ncbi:AAA domain-containing protein [Mycena sanguinolenta]|uniref:AAA domain-containing protein n=1 Tax=Mycena sanguinolenta TaxID=230812 RepID=A0A8H6YJF3_9AGAR|nr:AAA domain-containing protein [Mycena sanguinolenta]